METNNVIALVLGAVLIVVGPLIFVFRKQIGRLTRVGQRAAVGKLADSPTTVRRSVASIGVVGSLFLLSGIGFILVGLLRHSW
jgi:hypothetical protein